MGVLSTAIAADSSRVLLTLLLAWLADVPLVRASVAWHLTYLSNVFTFFRGEWPGMISHSAAPVVYVGRISYGLYLAHGFAGALARTLMLAVGWSWPVLGDWAKKVVRPLLRGGAQGAAARCE